LVGRVNNTQMRVIAVSPLNCLGLKLKGTKTGFRALLVIGAAHGWVARLARYDFLLGFCTVVILGLDGTVVELQFVKSTQP